MFGVLLDVSGSMRSAYALDRSRDASVQRTHAILTTIVNIAKREVQHHERRESIFACAFGLQGPTVTCDLIPMLEALRDSRGGKVNGHRALIRLAEQHGAPQADRWIRKHLSQLEAQILYQRLCSDTSLIPELIRLMPSQLTTAMTAGGTGLLSMFGASNFAEATEAEAVHRSQAYTYAKEVISDLKSKPVQDVSKMLDDLLRSKASSSPRSPSPSESLQDRIHEVVMAIEPYIYGNTPMCKAMEDALSVFQQTYANSKVLFVLSDGMSTDGDPRPIAQRLRDSGVSIVTCFLTSDHMDKPKCLLDEVDPSWERSDGRSVLFEMSSTMRNTHTPISYLVDAKWELPPSGVSRLFVQANSLDVVDELCCFANDEEL